MGIGVDRVDYTKGILERFRAIERFLEKYPNYQDKFTFVQIGAPSRTHIKRYHDLLAEVEAEAERINWRFQTGKWKPIVFLKRQHSHEEIESVLPRCRSLPGHLAARWYEPGGQGISRRAARRTRRTDPEPVHRRRPRIARRFAGESLRHRSDCRSHPGGAGDGTGREANADAPACARSIREHNIYHWAGSLITELCELRLDVADPAQEKFRDSVTAA